jgi:phosphate transport system substrate-binding protein
MRNLNISKKRRAQVRSRLIAPASILAIAILAALTLAACGSSNSGSDLSGTIKVDGSSTVGPLTSTASELFNEDNPDVKISVGTSGTGGGFEKFCAGETDMNDASREIEPEEEAACKEKNVTYEKIQVANDGIAVVVNPENTWAKCLTTAQLKKIWNKGSDVNNWNQVDPSFPDEPLKAFGPGTDSGTFEFFNEAINGDKAATRKDYSPSEDDNVTVEGVAGGKGNTGYFGLSYALQNKDKVKIVQVDSGKGCVTPDNTTVQDNSYAPLSRPLFVYPGKNPPDGTEALDAFVKYYVDNSESIATKALFVPMTQEQLTEAKSTADNLTAG